MDGSGFAEYHESVDGMVAKDQICVFKGNAAQWRAQFICSPLGFIVFAGKPGRGKQNDDSAFDECGYSEAYGAFYKVQESPNASRLKRRVNENLGTGMNDLLMGDQGYPRIKNLPPRVDLVSMY